MEKVCIFTEDNGQRVAVMTEKNLRLQRTVNHFTTVVRFTADAELEKQPDISRVWIVFHPKNCCPWIWQ
ncbi:MAG: hypothetical protein R3E08_10920 [Thiotrichaceae bacterium]